MPDVRGIPFAQHIRSRPGIYVGNTTARGLAVMIDDLIAEQLDTAGANAMRVALTLHPDRVIDIQFTGAAADTHPDDFSTDPALFKDTALRYLSLCGRFRDRAIFHPNTRFVIEDRSDPTTDPIRRDFHYPKGLLSYLEEIEYDWLDFYPDRRPLHFETQADGDRHHRHPRPFARFP